MKKLIAIILMLFLLTSCSKDSSSKEIVNVLNWSAYIPDEVIGEKIKELEDIELDLEATKRFYNDNSNIFNDLIDRFPSKIIGRKRGYDFKYLYSFDKEELFEILKNNKKKKNSEV